MQTKQDRTALIALVAGGIALLLGLCLGALGGSVAGYFIGRQVEKSAQQNTPPRQVPEMPALPELPVLPGGPLHGSGALIQEVIEDAPAQRAGLRVGDLITAVNDIPIDANHPLVEVLATFRPGDRVSLQVWRAARTITLDITLGRHPENSSRPYLGIRYIEMDRWQR